MPASSQHISGALFLTVVSSLLMSDSAPDTCAADSSDATPITQRINAHIVQSWTERAITPATECTDHVFVRRAFLDLAGRIPSLSERQRFLNDPREDRRAHLVDQLLCSEDYAVHFASTFDTLLMGRGKPQHYRDRQRHGWNNWLQSIFRDNRPWNVAVAEMLLARPSSEEDRGLIWFVYERNDDHQKLAEAIAPAFFGVRIECAQCHDHMSAGELEQRHYWGLVAFFSRSSNVKKKSGRYVAESAIGQYAEFADLSGSSAPNLLSFLDVPTVSEERPAAGAEETDEDDFYISGPTPESPRIPRNSRRQKFVEQVAAGHPRIARAFVNRIWALLLGRGIVHPFDEMDSMHDPSHPELLDELAEDFEESGYDIRRLVRGISLSRPYALRSVRPTGIEDPATFAWYLQRPITAEQMGRSIHLAVRGQLNHAPPLINDLRETIPEVLPSESVTTVQEALFLTNNSALNAFIRDSTSGSSLIAEVCQLDEPDEQVEKLFLTIFCREPSAAEVSAVRNYLSVPATASEQTTSDAGEVTWQTARLQQVIWSMLTSAEFRLNH